MLAPNIYLTGAVSVRGFAHVRVTNYLRFFKKYFTINDSPNIQTITIELLLNTEENMPPLIDATVYTLPMAKRHHTNLDKWILAHFFVAGKFQPLFDYFQWFFLTFEYGHKREQKKTGLTHNFVTRCILQ